MIMNILAPKIGAFQMGSKKQNGIFSKTVPMILIKFK
jgi:hypothetical protein